MRYGLRLMIIVGSILGFWRIVVSRQKRPASPSPETLILPSPATQRLSLTSVANLRDIGGFKTADGRTVKNGKLYRSASLAYVSDADISPLEQLGIQWICDLRTPEEIATAPDKVPVGAQYLQLSMLQLTDRWSEAAKMLFVPHYLDGMTAEIYIQMIDKQAEHFARIFGLLADPENLPILVHCTAGKDRTGVTVALLLRLLGVSEDDVLADYSQTNHAYPYIRNITNDLIHQLSRLGLREQDVIPLLLADPKNLKTALDYLKRTYESVEEYFIRTLRLEPDVIERIKANFLDD